MRCPTRGTRHPASREPRGLGPHHPAGPFRAKTGAGHLLLPPTHSLGRKREDIQTPETSWVTAEEGPALKADTNWCSTGEMSWDHGHTQRFSPGVWAGTPQMWPHEFHLPTSDLPCTSAQIARLRLGKPEVSLWFSRLSERWLQRFSSQKYSRVWRSHQNRWSQSERRWGS